MVLARMLTYAPTAISVNQITNAEFQRTHLGFV